MKSDTDNVLLVETSDSVDRLNAGFYGRFPYPWLPVKFDSLNDPSLHTRLLNQALGDWRHRLVPDKARIWVAGCGTNQAVFEALKYPSATVIGSDISETSLALCAKAAEQLGVTNLVLKQESLNHAGYRDEFDYLICTGVIHHNAEPAKTLERLAAALKPTGIMELMVYNRFHWIIPVAFQQALRTLCASAHAADRVDFETEMSITRRIMNDLPDDLLLSAYLSRYDNDSFESMVADELLQPVIYSYTVDSLCDMAAGCNLELLLPCLNQFDKEAGNHSWNLRFQDPVLRERYESLPDHQRWQIANLLLLDKSPMLWFYLQRTDSGRARQSEQQVCEEFLNTVFARTSATQNNFIRDDSGHYRRSAKTAPFPAAAPDAAVRSIAEAADGRASMWELFTRLELPTDFHTVNEARLKLTTPVFPYLIAVGAAAGDQPRPQLASRARQLNERELAEATFKKFKSTVPKPIRLPKED